MILNSLSRLSAAGLVLSVGFAGAVSAAEIRVTITNEQAPDGLFLTPLFSVFHDGTYDSFTAGGSASAGVEAIAETGNPMLAVEDATAAGATSGVVASPGGFPGAPVIDPGETASLEFSLDESTDRYFSYLSMVIPSNDLFIGNDNPMAYEIFDIAGEFTGIGDILIYTSDVWDAGTEANTNIGAAFNAAGGVADDTSNPISLAGSLAFLSGQNTAAGTTLNLPKGATLLARIEVSEVPVPAALPLMLVGLCGLGLLRRRRRN